jgi:hypothetical protein
MTETASHRITLLNPPIKQPKLYIDKVLAQLATSQNQSTDVPR